MRHAAALLATGCVAVAAVAKEQDDAFLRAPLASRNLSPLYANLGIPVLRAMEALPAGEGEVAWSLHWASHAVRESRGPRTLELDGETRRYDISLRAGLGRGLTLDVSVPVSQHRGGSLDAVIDDWHAFWGMPDGPRARQPRGRLLFAYTAPPGFLLDESAGGIGDVEIALGATIVTTSSISATVFGSVKLATGDEDVFTGSGDTGYTAGVRFGFRHCVFDRLRCHGQIGIADVGEIAYATEAHRRTLFASFALNWRLADTFALVAQLDGHEAVYRNAPLNENGAPVWGSLGLRWTPVDRWRVDGMFVEDLAVGAAPDISFVLGVARQF